MALSLERKNRPGTSGGRKAVVAEEISNYTVKNLQPHITCVLFWYIDAKID